MQPAIIVVGDLLHPKKFIVHFDGVIWSFPTFIQAMDVCFKLHYVLKIEYAAEARNVWTFLQMFAYKIKATGPSPDVTALISSL